jgi:hypothetical protein
MATLLVIMIVLAIFAIEIAVGILIGPLTSRPHEMGSTL